MDPRFPDWQSAKKVSPSTVSTKCSDLRRLEREYGDLDAHWQDDRCQSIFAELQYSAADEKANQPNPSRLKFNGDFRRNLGHFKSCLNSYAQFKQEVASELPEALEAASGDPATKGLTFGLELDLQSALRSNISQLADGLVVVDGGGERSVPSGRIDILAQDPEGTLVVIELKAVPASPSTLAQVLSYMSDLQESEGKEVRGIIVAPDFHPRLVAACRMVPQVQLVRYHVQFSFEPQG